MEKWKRSESLGNIFKPSLIRCESQLSNVTFLNSPNITKPDINKKLNVKHLFLANNTIPTIPYSCISKISKKSQNKMLKDELDKQSIVKSECLRVNSPFLRPSKPTPPKEMNH